MKIRKIISKINSYFPYAALLANMIVFTFYAIEKNYFEMFYPCIFICLCTVLIAIQDAAKMIVNSNNK